MKNLGYGKGYRYAHDEEDALRRRRALSARRHGAGTTWYRPTDRGLEARIARGCRALQHRDAKARSGDEGES